MVGNNKDDPIELLVVVVGDAAVEDDTALSKLLLADGIGGMMFVCFSLLTTVTVPIYALLLSEFLSIYLSIYLHPILKVE
jgi:hypothetical protein